MSSPSHHTQAYLDADKGPTILGLVITVSILSTIFVAGRVYTRKRIIGALHLDDWFTIVAVVCPLALFASLSAFKDLYLAVYPAVVLFHLQMNKRKKIALSFALGIGSIATIVAIYKCTRLPSLASKDFSYETSDLVIWTVIEASTIIIACCIPVLQPLVDALLGRRAFGSSPGYKNYNSSGYQNYGNSRAGPNIELSDSRKLRSDDRGNMTNVKYLGSGAAELDSQESILRHNGTKATDAHSADAHSFNAPTEGDVPR
ncbi:hypothetical protein LB503_010536 [Fusarium chuoi]|nr:hypothetical protein LB503_010536 [Fusarium chuoi]